jgi:hypothetical protein
MRHRLVLCVAAALFLFVQSPLSAAQAQSDKDAKTPEAKAADKCDAAATKEEVSVTDHTIRLAGQTIPYKATASTTLLKNDKGEATGLMYSVAYTRSDVKDLSLRPVSFLYNGGPGSATMWSAARAHRGWHVHASSAVQAGGQHGEPARQNRSRFHRRDGHRLQSRRLQSAGQGFFWN